jgi:putrescine aminotransferase
MMTDLKQLDLKHLIHAEVHFNEFYRRGSTIMVRGEGSTVYDTEGKAYLDAQAGLVLVNIGYGRRELAAAAARQMEQLMYYHTYFHFSNDAAVRLAAKLATMAPPGLGKVFYTLGGAEAVESAVKVARLYQRSKGRTQGDKVICLHQAYHGNTFGALSATGMARHKELFGPLVPGFLHIDAPDLFEGRWRYGDAQAGARYAALLEVAIQEAGPETVSAFLAEPILGVGGMLTPPADYWQQVRKICNRYGILLIADEVMTGFGRTGTDWAVEHFDVVPDLICSAKGLTSGYMPLGAVLVKDDVIAAIAAADLPFTHGFTYAGHPVACEVALANIAIYEREGLAKRSAQLGSQIMEQIRHLDNPFIGDVRGKGMMIGLEIVRDRGRGERFSGEVPIGFAIEGACFEEGIIIGVAPYRDTLMVTPPLVFTEQEADRLVAVLDRVVRKVCGSRV